MASEIKVDTISEKTSAGGVTIDGLLIKDGNISGDVALAGTTPTFTIGDAGAEDAALVFDGNAQDFYIALDDSADDLVIGLGSTVGTTPAISINSDRDVTISDGAIDFDVASHDTSNGLKLGGTLVTATAAELNIMDGVTSTATEINLLDGGTSVGSSITLADADGFIVNDGGTMKTIPASDISTYAGGGFSEVDSWVLTANLTGDADPITSNLARRSVTGWAAAKTGTGMSESSGIFTFPSTGQWLVSWQLQYYLNDDSRYDNYAIQVTTNNSSYSDIGQATAHIGRTHSGNTYMGVFGQTLIDVTDTANVKCRFKIAHHTGTAVTVGNHNGAHQMNFYRLADT
jgi:hypothetical protein